MRTIILIALFCIPAFARGQALRGKVFGENGDTREILPGATVHWIGNDTLVAAVNENGVFELPLEGISDRRLVAGSPFYKTDTFDAGNKTYISLTLHKNIRELNGVVARNKSGAYLSSISTAQTEVINRQELSKAACCDLAGCFGTQASIQPQTTNVVTNAQELRILGLSGVYNQVLFDGLPMISGLSYTYGISTYPGTIVENIFISKGTTSVLQGYESISGQINVESRQPDKTDKLHLNGYMNSFGEKHLNANLANPIGKQKKWQSMLALHMVQPAARTDGNQDGFMDLPLLTRYMLYNKWRYGNERKKGLALQIGLRVVDEQRVGGQMSYNRDTDEGSSLVYGQSVRYTQAEAYVKSLHRLSDNHTFALSVSGFFHEQHSWFGTTQYDARQQTGYLNLQHEWLWHKKHQLKYGVSYRYQELNETIRFTDNRLQRGFAGDYRTALRVPGLFAENSFHWKEDKMVLITGVRLDRHQEWGWYLTPRSMFKYAINEHHTFRASAGSGWRQVNLFSEQINLLASSRDIIFVEALKPEAAINWGISHTYRFEAGSTSGTLSADFYSTYFHNQFFPDYDTDPAKAIIRNFEGNSRSNGLQVDASLKFLKRWELRTAYNYLDVYRRDNNRKVNLPFNPRNRFMTALSYRSRTSRWQGDMNLHWFDRMRLPDTRSNPEVYRRPLWSTSYITVNVQATFRWETLEVYAGCENIANYRQPDPIIAANNPFSRYFDLSSVWGPTRGREIYLGVRYSIR